jgi:glycosyltransferase involved in cell wall biosynthesis
MAPAPADHVSRSPSQVQLKISPIAAASNDIPDSHSGVSVRLESPLPHVVPAGTAMALYCAGTAWDVDRPVADLFLTVDGVPHRVRSARMPRFDVPERRSGFWAVLPVRAGLGRCEVIIGALAVGPDGRQTAAELGRIGIEPDRPRRERGDLIAVCLATFEPQPEMFGAQIESLRAQTDPRWTCVISDDFSRPERYAEILRIVGDDERFQVSQAPDRIGFYRNFERALSLAPADAGLLALCDQDDVWYPDKLARLRGAMGAATLVYSDQRLVDERGRVMRDTLWKGRSNNRSSMASMLIANTVTGASALFRREVAEAALPFPDSPGIEFHDHWIALTALALGELAYVPEPLYDYVQHRDAILGKVAQHEPAAPRRRPRLGLPRLRLWRAAYFLGYVPGEIRARTLLLRHGPRMTAAKRRALRRYVASQTSPLAFAWFIARPLRMLAGRSETLGGEWELALGVIWRWLAVRVARIPGWPDRLTLDCRFPDPPHFEQKRLRRWRERI